MAVVDTVEVSVVGDSVTADVVLHAPVSLETLNATYLTVVNVKGYGAVGNGTTDDLAAINAAVAALGANGGTVYFPPGNYKVTGAITANQDKVHFRGAGIGATTITTSSATAHVFDFGDNTTLRSFLTVQDLMIATSVTRTAGAFIRARKVADLKVDRCRLDGAFTAIDLYNTQITKLTDLHIINCKPGSGTAVIADGNGNGLVLTRVSTDAPNGSQPARGLSLREWDGVWLTDVQLNHSGYGCVVEPDTGQTFNHLFSVNTSFDTCSGIGFLTGGAGTVQRLWLLGAWFGSCASEGAHFAANTTGVMLDGPKVFNNGEHGLVLSGCADVDVSNPQVSGNGNSSSGTFSGIFVTANTSRFGVRGGRSRPFAGFSNTQKYGVEITAGTSDYYTVANMDLNGNVTGGLSDGGSGSHKTVTLNLT